MENQNIKINLDSSVKELVIREGEAISHHDPLNLKIEGNIFAPKAFRDKRMIDIDKQKAHVIYSRSKGAISFIYSETSKTEKGEVIGKLSSNPALAPFGINAGKTFTLLELKSVLKMNRSYFADKDENLKVVANLEKFKASIQTQLESNQNDRGNKKQFTEVKVDSNLDLHFVLQMPIFVGMAVAKFKVEICFDIRDGNTSIWLESPELQDVLISQRNGIIDEVLKSFEDVVIIEQP